MPKKTKTYNGKYITFPDQQSLGETHDMFVKALPGQSYVKEPLHKVSTTQVTGDALMKVSVGGKGGFAAGTAGDVREQKKEMNAELIRMEKKKIYQQRLSCDKVVVSTKGKPKDYIYKSTERDYFDFVYQADKDPSDLIRMMEMLYATQDYVGTFKLEKPVSYLQRHGNKNVTYTFGTGERITLEMLESARESYDEICGYKGAHKYVGINGAEHRRYKISIENTLNFPTKVESNKGRGGNFYEPRSYACHHNGLVAFTTANYRLNNDCDEALEEWLNTHNNGHAYFTVHHASKKPEFKPETWRVFDPAGYSEPIKEPSEEYLRIKEASELLERERRLEALSKGPDLRDWRMVYNWELTKQGKTRFSNEGI